MQILIISLFDPIPGDPVGLIRYPLLAEALQKKGAKVTYISGSFFHLTKKVRQPPSKKAGYPIHLIKTPSYKRNIGPGRIFSHFMFGRRLKKFLDHHGKEADLILSAFPPIYPNFVLAKWAIKNRKRYWIDIQDLWPEAFQAAIGSKWLSRIILRKAFRMRSRILENASGVTAVTKDYLDMLGMEYPNKVFHLGMEDIPSDPDIDTSGLPEKQAGDIWVIFLGSSSRIPFLNTLIQNWKKLPSNYILVCAGDSGLFLDKEKTAPNVHIVYRPSQSQKDAILARGDVGLIVHDPALMTQMPYKTFAYLGHGMKVLTHIREGELASWIANHNLGQVFEENIEDFREKLTSLGPPEKERISSWANENLSKPAIYSKFADAVLSEMS